MRTPSRARRSRWPVAAALPWAAFAAVRATGAERGFPLVPALAFTPYAAASAAVPLALALRVRSRAGALLAAGFGAVLAAASLDRLGRRGATAAPPAPAATGPRVRLASLNLLHGHADPDAVVALARDRAVDLLVLVELPGSARERLRAAGLDDLLPCSAVLAARQGREDSWGAGVWSRLPAEPGAPVPGFSSQPTLRPAVPGARPVEVSALHSHPPVWRPWTVPQWERDLADLGAPRPDVVRLLAGDLNATPDHRALRDLLDRGWTDAARATGQGRRATWTPLHSPQPRLVLDHVLVDPRVGVAAFDVVRVPGTDHRALVADLVLPAS